MYTIKQDRQDKETDTKRDNKQRGTKKESKKYKRVLFASFASTFASLPWSISMCTRGFPRSTQNLTKHRQRVVATPSRKLTVLNQHVMHLVLRQGPCMSKGVNRTVHCIYDQRVECAMIIGLTFKTSEECFHRVILYGESKRVPELSGMRTDRIVLNAISVAPFTAQAAGARLLKASSSAPAVKKSAEESGQNPWGNQLDNQGHPLENPSSVSPWAVNKLRPAS